MLVLEVVLILMINDITEYQLHDEGMQKMRPYRKLSLVLMVSQNLQMLDKNPDSYQHPTNLEHFSEQVQKWEYPPPSPEKWEHPPSRKSEK